MLKSSATIIKLQLSAMIGCSVQNQKKIDKCSRLSPLTALFPYTTWQRLCYERPFCRSKLGYQFNDFIILLWPEGAVRKNFTLQFSQQKTFLTHKCKTSKERKKPVANLLCPRPLDKFRMENLLPSMETLHVWSIRKELSCIEINIWN